jgi:succinoglycan biosynthesis transport protein ExoP
VALQALCSHRLRHTFDDLAREYELIIVDSAPLLLVTDSLLLSQSVDGVIFSVLRDVSRLPAIQVARERLAFLGIRVLGAVVSGLAPVGHGYGYHSYGYEKHPATENEVTEAPN